MLKTYKLRIYPTFGPIIGTPLAIDTKSPAAVKLRGSLGSGVTV